MTGPNGSWAFVIVAGGSGSRIGGTPKQFRTLGTKPMWMWSASVARALYEAGEIDEAVVVFPKGFRAPEGFWGVSVEGGAVRTESVVNGLIASRSSFVLVHDAARPFLSLALCRALMARTEAGCGVVPLLPSTDSLKRVEGNAVSVVCREHVFRTQTPQAFEREALLDVLRSSGEATDEASLWLAAGRPLAYVEGEEANFKVTTEFDWHVARALAEGRRETRTGFGYDVHELVPGRGLILGGVRIPSPLGLLGHSDADILCHAISDALLGAAGEGDIGTIFPASDPRYRDADSTKLMEEVLGRLAKRGWRPVWIDVVLVAQVPRLGGALPGILENLGSRFMVYNLADKINLKVKSGEFVGDVGRAESMVCYATATIERDAVF